MSLLDIQRKISASDGITLSDAGSKELLRVRINEAAKEVYEADDFQEALEEEIFNIDVSSQVVAFPWYVEYLRGWRYHESRVQGFQDSKHNRYNEGIGGELWYRRFRHVKYSAIERDIENESVLELSIPLADTSDFTVSIVGKTTNSNRTQETITFAAGDLTHTTAGNFVEVNSIVKSVPTACDIAVKDVNDNVLTVIPNNLVECRYKITQILDCDIAYFAATTSAVEVLFKRKFQPFVNSSDEFMFGDKYDQAIYWKYKEHRAESDGENTEAAIGFHTKCKEALDQISSNMHKGMKYHINFTASGMFPTLPYLAGQKSYRYYSTRIP